LGNLDYEPFSEVLKTLLEGYYYEPDPFRQLGIPPQEESETPAKYEARSRKARNQRWNEIEEAAKIGKPPREMLQQFDNIPLPKARGIIESIYQSGIKKRIDAIRYQRAVMGIRKKEGF